ncbi:MAG: BrnA antitoxin family protein [Mariprofundaceae bacterium]|nr:BrnA antitoxin family protein [Mariprofundaceae bacterium]
MSVKHKIIMPTEEEDAAINAGIASDPEAAELTAEDFKRMQPASEVHPSIVKAYKEGRIRMPGQRGPQRAPRKLPISIRLSPTVVEHFRASGKGWQSRIDKALREWIKEHKEAA